MAVTNNLFCSFAHESCFIFYLNFNVALFTLLLFLIRIQLLKVVCSSYWMKLVFRCSTKILRDPEIGTGCGNVREVRFTYTGVLRHAREFPSGIGI